MSSLAFRRLSVLALLVPPTASAAAAPGGDTPTELVVLALPGPFGTTGDRVGSARDANGDGVNDLLVAGIAGVLTFDGATGELVSWVDDGDLGYTLPLAVESPGDVDGDGLPDIVMADGISARAWSRADGSVLWEHPGSVAGSIGWRMAVLGDLDGDGAADVAVGEPDADPNGVASAGTIHVLSGATGAVINQIHGVLAQDQVGREIAALGDLDGDGLTDLIVGQFTHKSGGQTVGRVRVLSAVNGQPLLEVVGTVPGLGFPIDVAGVGDLDGDGLPDLGVNADIGFHLTEVLSGADGSPVWQFAGGAVSRMESLGDSNGDGLPEVISGGPACCPGAAFALVHDGASGAALAVVPGTSANAFMDLAAVGDLDGDGHPEVLVANPGFSAQGTVSFAEVRKTVSPFTQLHLLANDKGGSQLGLAADAIADLDGDGHDDVVLASALGAVAFDPLSGAAIREYEAPAAQFAAGQTVRALATLGDLDGDGSADIALGIPLLGGGPFDGDGRVQVVSGASGELLLDLPGSGLEGLGAALAASPDRDGDGVTDFFVGAPGRKVGGVANAGVVLLLSGADGALLQTITGAGQASGAFGSSLSAARDLDGDGLPEVLVGSQEESPGKSFAGRALLLDGATFATLATFDGADNGVLVTGGLVGDADGDLVPDVLTAEAGNYGPGDTGPSGRIRLWSGADFSLLWLLQGAESDDRLGTTWGAAGDVNGDGYADVAAATGFEPPSRVVVASGRDGSVLDDFVPQDAVGAGGFLALGRLDAGACDDLLVGVTGLGGNGGARLYASSDGGPHGFTDLGFGKPGTGGDAPTLNFYGELSAGGLITVAARGAPPFTTCGWFFSPVHGQTRFKQGTLVPGPALLFLALLATDAQGELVVTLANPPSVFTGLELASQFWFVDAGATAGLSASNGVLEAFK